MIRKNSNKKFKIGLFIIFAIVIIINIFYIYLTIQFKIGHLVYDENKGIGKVRGLSWSGTYFIEWQDGSFSKETLSSLKGKKELDVNKTIFNVDESKKPDYFFYPTYDGKKAIIIDDYSENTVISSEVIPSYEEKGMFVWRIGENNCKPDYICGNWGECKYVYSLGSLLSGELILGTKSRICRDYSNCFSDFIEYKSCEVSKGIFTKKIKIGDKDYLEVYDANNDPVARLEFINETVKKLNIQILLK